MNIYLASCCTYLPEVKLDPRTNLAVDFQPFLFYLKLLETDVNNPSLFLDRKSKTIVGVVAIDTKLERKSRITRPEFMVDERSWEEKREKNLNIKTEEFYSSI